jgi:hypothetical protein
MSDDLSKRGGQDRSRIAMEQEHEVGYWTGTRGVTKEELTQAVQQVGNSVRRRCGNISPHRSVKPHSAWCLAAV